MPLTQAQTFKVGFLYKCAEDGLTLEEIKLRVKAAIYAKKTGLLEKKALLPQLAAAGGFLGNGLMNLAGKVVQTVPSLASAGGMLAIGAPVAAGAATGYLASKATGTDKNLVDDAKSDEVIGEYERLAEEARRRARLKKLQAATGQRVIALTPGER